MNATQTALTIPVQMRVENEGPLLISRLTAHGVVGINAYKSSPISLMLRDGYSIESLAHEGRAFLISYMYDKGDAFTHVARRSGEDVAKFIAAISRDAQVLSIEVAA